jgi:hypothetical protein
MEASNALINNGIPTATVSASISAAICGICLRTEDNYYRY